MATDFLTALAERKVLLCEGAMGTMLQAKGVGDTLCPELWNLEHPEHIADVHRQYFAAGSEIALTNTFGASRFKLTAGGVDTGKQTDLIASATKIAREQAGDGQFVFGDIGPTGEVLEPYGLLSKADAMEDFKLQAEVFAANGADAIIIETMMDLGEMEAAVQAVKDACDLPVVCSMTYNPGAEGYRTMFGQSPTDATKALADLGADVIGTNCSVGIEDMIEMVREISAAAGLPVIAQPNAGIPIVNDEGQNVYPAKPDEMARQLPLLVQAGARIIGGCCGTSPDFIKAFRQAADAL